MSTFQKTRGFTLIELVIVVTILLILGALAIPNYRNYVLRANRSDAMTALLHIAAAQEKFYMQNNTYTNDLTASGLNVDTLSPNKHYAISVTGASANGFLAKANPADSGHQSDDTQCTEFRVNQDGTKSASGSAADKCWR